MDLLADSLKLNVWQVKVESALFFTLFDPVRILVEFFVPSETFDMSGFGIFCLILFVSTRSILARNFYLEWFFVLLIIKFDESLK